MMQCSDNFHSVSHSGNNVINIIFLESPVIVSGYFWNILRKLEKTGGRQVNVGEIAGERR